MKLFLALVSTLLMSAVGAAPPPLPIDPATLPATADSSPRAARADGGDSTWQLTAFDVYAEGATTVRVDAGFRSQLPPSTLRFLRMRERSGEWLGVLVLDAEGAFVAATVFGERDIHRGEVARTSQGTEVRFAPLEDSMPPGLGLVSRCDTVKGFSPSQLPSLAPPGARANESAAGALVQARLAIDTDNEFMQEKFANDTNAASNYVAQLVALMTVIYERDLGVRLAIGTSILRTDPDPYTTSGSSTPAQLNEFGEYWRVNQGGVARAFALQLSGKAASAFQASGIAWLLTSGNYCTATGQVSGPNTFGHFSVNQVFTFGGSTAANDVSLVAHELGHNFGANHTHCTDTLPAAGLQPIDMCFNNEAGCYSGAVSCPVETGNRGTLMSYCHFGAPSGAACGSVRQEFHPFHITQLSARVLTNTQNGCFTAVPPASNNIFANSFE